MTTNTSKRPTGGLTEADLSADLSNDLLWGVAAIAKAIGRTERQTFHLLSKNLLPARKIGGRYCAARSTLRKCLTGE